MPFFSRKSLPLDPPASPPIICVWSAHAPQSGPSPFPFPRDGHTLTATATAAGVLFLFGGLVNGCASNDLYVFSTRDFSTTLLQTSGEDPSPRYAHGAALIDTTTLLICGGQPNFGNENVLNHDSLCLLNLGTLDLLMSSPTPADHGFAVQYRKSGPALWSRVLCPTFVLSIPQSWSVPSSSYSVVGSARMFSMICGHSI